MNFGACGEARWALQRWPRESRVNDGTFERAGCDIALIEIGGRHMPFGIGPAEIDLEAAVGAGAEHCTLPHARW